MLVYQIGSSFACSQATLLLHRFGAKIVKLGTDSPPELTRAETILFECLDFEKTIDSRAAEQLSVDEIEHILQEADVVFDSRPLSFWRKRGVDLRTRYLTNPPKAHWCGITGYGLTGAGEDAPGCELTYQASGPQMNRLGEPDRPPLPIKGPQAEINAGWHAALLVAGADFGRKGQPGLLLDVSMQECQYMHAELGPANWHFNGVDISRSGMAVRHSVYPSADGEIHMLFHDREWPRVAEMIGREDLAQDERFMSRHQRMQHLEEVDALLVPWFMERTRAQAVEDGQAAGMPIAFNQDQAAVLADPQLNYRNAFETIPTSAGDMKFGVGVAPLKDHPDLGAGHRRNEPLPASPPGKALPVRSGPRDELKPLAGVRVLDLTNTWAGPRGATLLGDLGAEIVKIEGIEWMDMLRGFTAPPNPHDAYPRRDPGDKPWDRYLMWLGLARNKLNGVFEFTKPEGREILDDLVRSCDVVLTNMSVGTRAKYGLAHEQLQQLHPGVIFVTLSGYGDEGPRSTWKLFGDGQAAMAGIFFGTGYLDGESLSWGAYGDPVNGVSTAFHVVQALRARERTGRGTWVDLSAVETCLTFAARSLIEHQLGQDAERPVDVDSGTRQPHGVYRAAGADRWLAISCGNDKERQALVAGLTALGASKDNPTAAAILNGTASEDEARDYIESVTTRKETDVIEKALQSRGAPCQRVMRAFDADADAILNSRQFLSWLWREDLGSYPLHNAFWLINTRRPPIELAPARYSEHTKEILTRILGRGEGEIEKLRQLGVTADRPMAGAELGVRPADRKPVAT